MSRPTRDGETKKRIDDSINIITLSLDILETALKELSNLMVSSNREEQERVVKARPLILESLKSSVEEARSLFNIPNVDDSKDYVR